LAWDISVRTGPPRSIMKIRIITLAIGKIWPVHNLSWDVEKWQRLSLKSMAHNHFCSHATHVFGCTDSSGVASVVFWVLSRAVEQESCSANRVPSFDASFVTITDTGGNRYSFLCEMEDVLGF
jgi:hypothetical protein